MLSAEHRKAQLIADQADSILATGDYAKAEQLYARAADLEERCLAQLPRDKVRTIGIIGASAATLWYRAAEFAKAEHLARHLLAEYDLFPSAQAELQSVLEEVSRSGSRVAGRATVFVPPTRPQDAPKIAKELQTIRNDASTAQADPDDIKHLYITHRTLLLFVAVRKFNIPERDAENLLQDVFLSFLQTATKSTNVRLWLVDAMCKASRHYWRNGGRASELVEVSKDEISDVLTIHSALDLLPPRSRESLWSYYFENRPLSEIAHQMGTTLDYARRLIERALKRARSQKREDYVG